MDHRYWQKSLRGCLLIANAQEVFYIKDVDVSDIFCFVHKTSLYTELYANLDGIAYKSLAGDILKKKISCNMITVSDSTIIIKPSIDNIAFLLLDPNELVRRAAADWHRENLKVS